MVGVAALLTEARHTGLAVWAEADNLVIRGPRSCAALAQQLMDQKQAVLAVLAGEEDEQHRAIAWRITVMRPQVPERGPIPVLIARSGTAAKGCCVSCGDPLPHGARVRCSLCARAAYQVLHEIREDVTSVR